MGLNPFARKNVANLGAISDPFKKKAEKIGEIAKEIADMVTSKIWDAGIQVGEYKALREAINADCDTWFNEKINERKIQSIIENPDPRKRVKGNDELEKVE
jgi:hypothetical protein